MDSVQFYTIFYPIIHELVDSSIKLTIFKSVEEKKQHVLNVLYKNTLFTQIPQKELIQMIGNDLQLYLEMVRFVRDKELPFMPAVLDPANVHLIFNRFCYHYAKMCINNKCSLDESISKKINSI